MKDLLQNTIEQLRSHVMKNLELVRENEREIKEMLKEPVSVSRAQALTDKYEYSKKVLAENNDFINLQLSIINFIYKYKNVWGQEEVMAVVEEVKAQQKISRDECFELTIGAKMKFDSEHPYFNDDDFFNQILEFFQQQEDYERCDALVKMRK
jgi:hypothetical protein